LVWHEVAADRVGLTISVPLADRIEFVEILSEQEVRLLMLPVLRVPPEGEYERFGDLEFGDGRSLSVRLTFDDPWPKVRVEYGEAQKESASVSVEALDAGRPIFGQNATHRPEIAKTDAVQRLLQWAWNPSSWVNPRFVTSAIAVVMAIVLFFLQTRETSANAAELVSRMEAWQRSAARPGSVLHRRFELIRRDKHSSQKSERRVEVWRKAGTTMKISRLFDDSGRVLDSVQLSGLPSVLTESNVWQFEPAADTYRALAGNLAKVRVRAGQQRLELISSSATLSLDGGSFAPREETIETAGATFEFREQSWESEPERSSPFATFSPKVAPIASASKAESKQAESTQPVDNPSETELAVRYALHGIGADLDEPIEVQTGTRGPGSVSVVGIVASSERRQQVLAALAGISGTTARLQTEEEAAQILRQEPTPARRDVPPAVTVHSPIDKKLLTYLGDPLAVENFSNRAAALTNDLMAHAWALRHLSERYPAVGAQPETPLSAPSRELLQIMRRDHQQAMSEATSELRIVLRPVLVSIAGASSEPSQRLSLFAGAQEVRRLTLDFVYGSESPNTKENNDPTTVARDLLSALRGLEITLEELQ
jgi:hypothetical protein